VALDCIRRDLHEAINRLYQSRDRLEAELTEPRDQGIWDVFEVLTTDLLKANRSLDSIRGAHTAFPPQMYIESAANYLRAASRRATEFDELMSERGVEMPATFQIMCRDLKGAIDGLTNVNLPAMAPYRPISADPDGARSTVSAQPD
jgi:hypothetical protein